MQDTLYVKIMAALRSYKSLFLCSIVSALWLLVSTEQHVHPDVLEGNRVNTRFDKNMVQDKDHIMDHLDGVIDKPEQEMSSQELQLHYFKMHDSDGNNLLDGLELAAAISHVHKEDGGQHTEMMKDEDLISLIDGVLRDDDKNNDGYIDYAEFAKSME
ncbi:multiple coagulation factor deficiency protein 2 isoform X2 [Lissotriton helveticus]